MTYTLGKYLRSLRGNESLRSVSERSGNKLSHSYISDIEKGLSRRGNEVKPSPETLKTLADVYNADYHYLMELAGYLKPSHTKENAAAPIDKNDAKQPYYTLNKKEEKDIAKKVENIIEGLNTDTSLNFYGEPMTNEDKELFAHSLEVALRITKEKAKKKFTPKKYRKDD